MSKSFSVPGIFSLSSSAGWVSFESPEITYNSKASSDKNISKHPIRWEQVYEVSADILETDFDTIANLESVITEKQDIFCLADRSFTFKNVKLEFDEKRERKGGEKVDKLIIATSTNIPSDVTNSIDNLLLVTGSMSSVGSIDGFAAGWSGSDSGSAASASIITGSEIGGFSTNSKSGFIQKLTSWNSESQFSTTIPVPLIGDVFFTFSFYGFSEAGNQDYTLFIRLLDKSGATQREALKTWLTGSEVNDRPFIETPFYNVTTQIEEIQIGFINNTTWDDLYIDNAQLEHGLLSDYTTK